MTSNNKEGLLSTNWKTYSIREIADQNVKWSFTGGPFGSNLKASDYKAFGIRIIQLQNIGDGKFLNKYKIYTSPEKANELLGCNIYPDDIIISKMGDPVARACKIPNFENRYVMSSDGIRLKVDTKKFDTNFILYSINDSKFRREANERSIGTTRKRIGLDDLKNLKIKCPPLKEQQKIAAILSKWDVTIETQTKLIKAKEKQKKSLMQKLITGKERFPGFKQKWKKVNLKECSLISGEYGINAPGVPFNFDLPKYLRITDIEESGNTLRLKNMVSVNDKESYRYLLDDKDIVFARTGASVGKSYLHHLTKYGQLVFAGFLIRFRTNQEVLLPEFLKQYCDTKEYWDWVSTTSQRSGQPGINGKEYGELTFYIPCIDEQHKIASFLEAVDQEIQTLKDEVELLQIQKKGLMGELLTGRVRVNLK